MRTPFIVGIFGLAVAVAVTTEWASRRTAGQAISTEDTAGPVLKGPVEKAATSEPPAESGGLYSAPKDDPDRAADGEQVLVLGGDGGFRLNAIRLSDPMLEQIDALLKGPDAPDLVCSHFVIEGHADSLGSKDVNDNIALARAIAVQQYLSQEYEIPRDMVKIVSYGADRPAGDNATQEGRTKNRRVVIRMIVH